MKKLIYSGLLALSVTLLLGTNVKAATSTYPPVGQNDSFHEGETPLETFVDKDTGVVVKKYKPHQFHTLGAGTWDKIATERWLMSGDWGKEEVDTIHESGGGNYMVSIPPHSAPYGETGSIYIGLYEADPYPNPDDFITPFISDNHIGAEGADYVWSNLNKYVDGTNNKAELYTVHHADYQVTSPLYVQYFD